MLQRYPGARRRLRSYFAPPQTRPVCEESGRESIRSQPNQDGKNIQSKFSSKAYGDYFLGLLIKVFEEHGHDFETPESVMLVSKENIEENKLLSEFIDDAFERTGDNNDRVSLVKMWELLVSMREYYDHLGMKILR
jgi:hypothetical protein